jgi:hypothetical protein
VRRGASSLGRVIRALVIVGAAVLVWPPLASAQARRPVEPNDQVVLSGDVMVPRGHVVGEVVVFDGSATISGVVAGDVVVLRGPVVVAGQVGGDVIALDGPVKLAATAQITGDVRSGGDVAAGVGAQVGGAVHERVGFTLSGTFDVLGTMLPGVAVAVSVLPVLLVLLLLVPRAAERVAATAASAPIKAVGWGLLVGMSIPIVGIAGGLSVVALPLGLVVVLGAGLVWIVGLSLATLVIGRLVVRPPRSRIGALIAGWAIAGALSLVPYLNGAWWVLGSIFGVGSAVVAAWRARRGDVSLGEPKPRSRAGRHRAGRIGADGARAPVPEASLSED